MTKEAYLKQDVGVEKGRWGYIRVTMYKGAQNEKLLFSLPFNDTKSQITVEEWHTLLTQWE